MATIGQFLGEILKRAGVDVMQPQYADVLSLTGDMPDEAATQTLANLVTTESAKTNPDLKRHYFSQAYNGIDALLREQMDAYFEDQSVVAELSGIKNTTERVKAFSEKLKTSFDAKVNEAKATTSPKHLQDEVAKLRKEYEDLKAEGENKIKTIQAEYSAKELNAFLDNTIVAAGDLSDPIKSLSANARRTQMLEWIDSENGKIINKEGKYMIVRKDDPDYPLTNNGTEVSVDSLVHGLAAKHNWLKVSEGSPAGGKTVPQTAAPVVTTQPNANSKYIADLQASIKADQVN